MKLSRLQKTILYIAYMNREKYPKHRVDVSVRQLLTKFYDFIPISNIDNDNDRANIRHLVFNQEAIGIKKYNSPPPSTAKCLARLVIKSFNTLVSRRLAERHYRYAIKLTEAGIEVAKELAK